MTESKIYPRISRHDKRSWTIPYAVQELERTNPETGEPESYYGYESAYHVGVARPNLAQIKTCVQAAVKADAEARIISAYPWWVQVNIADGTYSADLKAAMLAYKAAVISAENAAYDLVEAAQTIEVIQAVVSEWPEEG